MLFVFKLIESNFFFLLLCFLHYSIKGNGGEQDKRLLTSSTLYVGNLSFFTTEEQIHELFSRAGDVKRIIMGLDKTTKTPCKIISYVH